jgi:hypothetical protein
MKMTNEKWEKCKAAWTLEAMQWTAQWDNEVEN